MGGVQDMAVVMIKCPDTGRSVSTGIEIERIIFIRLPDVEARMSCSACGREHRWSKHAARLAERAEGGAAIS
jgi:hypothetical protein